MHSRVNPEQMVSNPSGKTLQQEHKRAHGQPPSHIEGSVQHTSRLLPPGRFFGGHTCHVSAGWAHCPWSEPVDGPGDGRQ